MQHATIGGSECLGAPSSTAVSYGEPTSCFGREMQEELSIAESASVGKTSEAEARAIPSSQRCSPGNGTCFCATAGARNC